MSVAFGLRQQVSRVVKRVPSRLLSGLAAVLASAALFPACSLYRNTFGGLHQAFWSKTPAHRCAAIEDYSLPEQLDLYVQGRTERTPPDPYIVGPVASHGAKIVPLVVEHLKRDPSDSNRLALLRLLEVISADDFDLSKDTGLLATLNQVAGSMKDPAARLQADATIRKIAIRNYPLAQQLDTYLNGDGPGSPDYILGNAVAANGAAIVPLVVERLQQTKSDLVRLDLLSLLVHVSPRYDDLSKDSALLATLRAAADSMTDAQWRQAGVAYVNQLQAGTPAKTLSACDQLASHKLFL